MHQSGQITLKARSHLLRQRRVIVICADLKPLLQMCGGYCCMPTPLLMLSWQRSRTWAVPRLRGYDGNPPWKPDQYLASVYRGCAALIAYQWPLEAFTTSYCLGSFKCWHLRNSSPGAMRSTGAWKEAFLLWIWLLEGGELCRWLRFQQPEWRHMLDQHPHPPTPEGSAELCSEANICALVLHH